MAQEEKNIPVEQQRLEKEQISCERKRNVPRPVQRKRALGAAFVRKAAPFSYVSMS